MGNISTILVTSVATLIVTIIAGLLIEYLKRIKPKIIYRLKEAIPIKLDDKLIGANVLTIENPSSITVKDIVVIIKSELNDIKNGGIRCTKALDYKIDEVGNTLTVTIPFLKKNDEFSITTVTEGRSYIRSKPELSIRSPDNFKLVEDNELKESKRFKFLTPGIIAGSAVAFALFTNIGSTSFVVREQSNTLTIAAAEAGLPELAESYAMSKDIYYYPQGALAYSKSKSTSDLELIKKYKRFISILLDSRDYMNGISVSALSFYLGQIELLLGEKDEAEEQFKLSEKSDSKEYNRLKLFHKM